MSIVNLEILSKLYYQKFFRKIADDLQDIKDYLESTPQETKKLLRLFQLRNESHKEEKGTDNPRFKEIIEFLNSCKESKLVMHIIKVKDQLRTILTDTNYTQVICEF
jgi:NAD-specific glutamate dehydrogenase